MNIAFSPEIITTLLSVGTTLVVVTAFLTGIKGDIKVINKRLDNVENRLGTVENRLGTVENRLGTVESRLGTVEKEMFYIKGRFTTLGASPLKLTDAGKDAFDFLNGKEFIDTNYESLKKFVGDESEKYLVLEKSIKAVEQNTSDFDNVRFREYAYNNGWNVTRVYEALGVYLRDRIFDERISKDI